MTQTVTKRVVREIPSAAMFNPSAMTREAPRMIVAAYARVSTEKEEQEDSFERQVEHYTTLIKAKSEWQFGGIYADPGITGTRAEKRPDFMRMIDDCRAGKIQKILVKSISRFARNTVDALSNIRELRDLGIGIYFESENIDTLTPGGEVLITILAAMAEQESRTMSTNIKWSYQKKFQAGEIILNTGLMLGYRKTEEKDADGMPIYEINEAEAEIVRRIYSEYISGITVTRICRGLESDGIPTPLGKKKWHVSVVKSILSNEKYTGNAVLGKTFKPDVLSKHRQKNDGTKAPMYYTENSHPAIIETEMFNLAKAEMKRRGEVSEKVVGNSRYTSKYPFSGILVCGECGALLRRHVRTMGTGNKVPSWACRARVLEGRAVCDSHHIREDVLERTYAEAIKQMTENTDEIMEAIRESAQITMAPENAAELANVEKDIIELQEKALTLHKQKQQHAITDAAYEAEICRCSTRMQELEAQQAGMQNMANRYAEVKTWLDTFEQAISSGSVATATDTALMKTLVERITVNDDGIMVTFKCGATVTQKYVR